MTLALIGFGSKFSIDPAGGVAFTDLGEVTNITPPSDSVDVIEATHMQSPNATKEYLMGLNDPGTASFELNFVPGSASDLLIQQVRAARIPVNCRVTFPNAVTWTFTGILTAYTPAVPTDAKMTATVSFKVTGSYLVA